jgi:aryl-alcohol dehydrogenase-like predicted oxidoreductase
MFDVRFKGLRIVVSDSAMRELFKEGKTLFDIADILENGYEPKRKRAEGTIERWLDKGNKTFNAVVCKDHNEMMKEDVFVLIHFGKFTRR